MATAADPAERRDALVERLFIDAIGAFDLFSVHIGERLGLYRALDDEGPLTSSELAEATGIHERYAREWLEQQAVTGLLTVADAGDPADRRYSIPAATAEVLTDESSLTYLAPIARMFASSAIQMPALLDAYRSGGGVGWEQLGPDARESQADMNRPL